MLVNKILPDTANIKYSRNFATPQNANGYNANSKSNEISFKQMPLSKRVNPFTYLLKYYIEKTAKFSKRKFYDTIPELQGKVKKVVIKTADNVKLNCLDINPNKSNNYVLFLHGMSTNISMQQEFYLNLNKKGFGVFALEYRGYGANPRTKIDENLLNLDINAAIKYLKDNSDSVDVVAHSAGTALAVKNALENPEINSLVLAAPVDGLLNTNIETFEKKGLEASGFVRKLLEKYPNLNSPFNEAFRCSDGLKDIDVPTYIIHSANDGIISVPVAENLAGQTKNLKVFLILSEGGHRFESLKEKAAINFLSEGLPN